MDEALGTNVRDQTLDELLQEMNVENGDGDLDLDGGLTVPVKVRKKLFKYQKTCVKWYSWSDFIYI